MSRIASRGEQRQPRVVDLDHRLAFEARSRDVVAVRQRYAVVSSASCKMS